MSRKLGEQDREGVSIVTEQGFILMSIIYIIFLLFGLYGVRQFFEMQTKDFEIVNLGIEYSSIVMIFSFVIFEVFMCLISILFMKKVTKETLIIH